MSPPPLTSALGGGRGSPVPPRSPRAARQPPRPHRHPFGTQPPAPGPSAAPISCSRGTSAAGVAPSPVLVRETSARGEDPPPSSHPVLRVKGRGRSFLLTLEDEVVVFLGAAHVALLPPAPAGFPPSLRSRFPPSLRKASSGAGSWRPLREGMRRAKSPRRRGSERGLGSWAGKRRRREWRRRSSAARAGLTQGVGRVAAAAQVGQVKSPLGPSRGSRRRSWARSWGQRSAGQAGAAGPGAGPWAQPGSGRTPALFLASAAVA